MHQGEIEISLPMEILMKKKGRSNSALNEAIPC